MLLIFRHMPAWCRKTSRVHLWSWKMNKWTPRSTKRGILLQQSETHQNHSVPIPLPSKEHRCVSERINQYGIYAFVFYHGMIKLFLDTYLRDEAHLQNHSTNWRFCGHNILEFKYEIFAFFGHTHILLVRLNSFVTRLYRDKSLLLSHSVNPRFWELQPKLGAQVANQCFLKLLLVF